MKKSFSFNRHNVSFRIFACFICALTLFGFFCRPVTVYAEDLSGYMTVGTAAGLTMVPPNIAVVILLVIAGGLVCREISDYVDKATAVYNSSTVISSWADAKSAELAVGASVLVIDPDVVSAFNASNLVTSDLPAHSKYLVVPPFLTRLDDVRVSDLIVEDFSDVLDVNNTLTSESNSILRNVSSYLYGINNAFHSFTVSFSNLLSETLGINTKLTSLITQTSAVGSAVSTLNDNTVSRLRTINATLNERLAAVETRIRLLDDNITTRLADIRAELYTINSNISDRLHSIREMQTTINTNLTTRLKSIRDMQSTINTNLEDRMINVRDAITGELVVVGGNLEDQIRENRDVIVSGLDKIPIAIDNLGLQWKNDLSSNFDAIDSKLDQLIGSGVDADSAIGSFATTSDDVVVAENSLKGSTGAGKNHMQVYLRLGDSVLTEFGDAFLALAAILNMFLSIAIIKQLVEFSLAIGIFALLVNLSNTLSKSGNFSQSKKTGKGG